MKNYKLDIRRFIVNYFLDLARSLVKAFPYALAYLRYGLSMFTKLNVFLVNIGK